MKEFTVTSIAIAHTPHKQVKGGPIQPTAAEGVQATIEVLPEFVQGLKDIEGFSHLILLYKFDRITDYELEVIPFMDTVKRGIFATRAPKRPNGIGISTVKLVCVEGNILHIEDADMLDGTPIIDIKPFYPRFDNRENVKIGWLEKNKDIPVDDMKADNRFKENE